MRISFVGLSCVGLLVGCINPGELLRTRAAFDFKCPAEQIQMQPLGDNFTQGVTGCGRQGTYVYDANRATWVLNSESDAKK